jgi:hypothetical protein
LALAERISLKIDNVYACKSLGLKRGCPDLKVQITTPNQPNAADDQCLASVSPVADAAGKGTSVGTHRVLAFWLRPAGQRTAKQLF